MKLKQKSVHSLPINKFLIVDTIELFLAQLGYFYEARKSNKIQIKKLFYHLPFFFFNKTTQNDLFTIIQKYDVPTYSDTTENMKHLCYNIYHDIGKKYNLDVKTYDEFYSSFELSLQNEKKIIKKLKYDINHTIIILIFILIVLSIYLYMQYIDIEN